MYLPILVMKSKMNELRVGNKLAKGESYCHLKQVFKYWLLV